MVKNGKDFSKGKIYCIRNNIDDEIYIGSTTQPLSKRFKNIKVVSAIVKDNGFYMIRC